MRIYIDPSMRGATKMPNDTQPNQAGVGLEIATDLSPTPETVGDKKGNESPLEISTNDVIVSSGNLGIGTNFGVGTNPIWPLHVGVSKTARFELTDANAMVSLGAPGAFNVDAINVPGGRFTITNDGNVGISQANPQYRLEVNGTFANPSIQPMSSAPSSASLKQVYVDTTTGVFYYQS